MSTTVSSMEEQQQQQQSFSDWSQLHEDLVEMVAKELNAIEDLYSMGGVCHSWRSVTLSIRKHKNKTLPWLMITADSNATHRDFYSVAEDKNYRLNYLQILYKSQCWGSPIGWVVSFSFHHREFRLVNPFSPKFPCFTLPPIYTLPDKHGCHHRRYIFKSAVFQIPPEKIDQFLVFTIYSARKNMAYCRPGDDTWNRVTFPETISSSEGQLDILHLNGQFYSVDSHGSVWLLCDIASGCTNPSTAVLFASPPPMYERPKICEKTISLINMEGYLHVAVRFQHRMTRKTLLIEIFKYEVSTREWQKLTTLGNYALFLGTSTSIPVNASVYSAPNCMPNHIYFCYDDYEDRAVLAQPDTGIIDFENFEMQPMNAEDKLTRRFSAPTWVIPNLL